MIKTRKRRQWKKIFLKKKNKVILVKKLTMVREQEIL